jgi:16S rRNA (guanine(1405)-N(7))-methyltransferase
MKKIIDLEKTFLDEIKANKKYSNISSELILKEIKEYLRKNPNIQKISKQDVKDVRAKLHRLYSSYQTRKKSKKREIYLAELKNREEILEITKKLLSLVVSTKERLEDYLRVYETIFKITGKPNIIVDIGCGLNPLSYPLMKLEKLDYYAYDIDEEDMIFLNNYFKIMKDKGLNGNAKILDVNNKEKIDNLPNSDIIFLFKTLDLVNINKNKLIENLLKKTKFLVVSFATKTLTGRPMKLKRRTGFEAFLIRNNFKFKIIEISNEIFYIIKSNL